MREELPRTFKVYLVLVCTFLVLFSNCKHEEEHFFGKIIYDNDSDTPLVTFLYNPADSVNIDYNKHIKKTINYTKIPYKVLPYKTFLNSTELPKTTKVLIITNTKILNDAAFKKVVEFVANGGTLFLPRISNGYKYRFLAGVKPDVNHKLLNYADGFKFTTDYIPGLKGKTYTGYSQHYGYKNKDYNNNVSVWASSLTDDDFPTILSHKLEQGNVVFFNSKLPAIKADRGLYFSGILLGLEGVPYPVMDVSTMFLDDFPAPTYHIKKEPVLTEYNATHSDFYNKIWWPDMLKLAEKENLKYTSMVCFDYGESTKPPFIFKEWSNSTLTHNDQQLISGDYIIEDAIKNDHEVAFHGYNHTSLLKTDWPNFNYMKSALQAVEKKWRVNNYGKLPITYVPPSNHIDGMGLQALTAGMPSIKYNCSLYLGYFDEGGEREYDYEPHNNALFNFPRITSGYTLNDQSQYDQYSLFLYTGIWSHFVHPDDVYQIKDASNSESRGNFAYRNKDNLGWVTSKDGSPGMLPRFEHYLQNVKQRYPLLRFLKTETAAAETIAWRYSNYKHKETAKHYTVSSDAKALKNLASNYWFVYVSQSNTARFENDIKRKKLKYSKTPHLNGFLFNIETNSPNIKLLNLRNPSKNSNVASSSLKKANLYKSENEKNDFDFTLKTLIAIGKIDEGIKILKDKISSEDINAVKDWRHLYEYLGWKGRDKEIWPLLNEEYEITQSISLIDLSMEFTENNDYPDLETRKLWLDRQIEVYPDNTDLHSQYEYYFDTNITTSIDKIYLNKTLAQKSTNIDLAEQYTNKGHIKHAWMLADLLPTSQAQKSLKKRLNAEVLGLRLEDKSFLFKNHFNLFSAVNAKKLRREIIKQNNPFIAFETRGISDNSFTTVLNNQFTYGYKNYRKQQHLFGLNNRKLYTPKRFIKANGYTPENLTGISYQFKTRLNQYKPQLTLGARLEQNNFKNYFYHINSKLEFFRKNNSSALTLRYNPVQTALGYHLNIYNTGLKLEHNRTLKILNIKGVLRSNYFSDNNLLTNLTINLSKDFNLNKTHKIAFNSLTSNSFSNKTNTLGFPYWIKKRFYTGGGLNYLYSNFYNDLTLSTNLSTFYDSYFSNFSTFRASISAPLFDYFHVKSDVNLSTIKNIFTNTFNIQLTYYLNKPNNL